MKTHSTIVLAVVAASGILAPSTAEARQVEDWPYDRLGKEAGVIVIARAVSIGHCKDQWNESVFEKTRFQGLETTFEVLTTLKGQTDKSLAMLHFQYKAGESPYNDGPGLVSFSMIPLSIDNRDRELEGEKLRDLESKSQSKSSAPEYLLFLKKRNDGRYEAVSGQLDPKFSVSILLPHVVSRSEKGLGKDAQPTAITHVCLQADAAKTAAPKGFKVTPAQALEKAQPYFPSNPFALALYADDRFYYVERTGRTLFVPKDHLEMVREHGIKIDGGTGEVVRGVKKPPAK